MQEPPLQFELHLGRSLGKRESSESDHIEAPFSEVTRIPPHDRTSQCRCLCRAAHKATRRDRRMLVQVAEFDHAVRFKG